MVVFVVQVAAVVVGSFVKLSTTMAKHTFYSYSEEAIPIVTFTTMMRKLPDASPSTGLAPFLLLVQPKPLRWMILACGRITRYTG